jgi:2-keto-3-deoxy-L-rhamnonate aldolase RhmA
MPIIANRTLAMLREGKTAIGFGVGHLRTAAVPLLAQAAGYDWLFIDGEHGAFTVDQTTQICLAALPTGVTPLVRICRHALDEGTRALDNGAMGIVVPHVDTAEEAARIAAAFRFPPRGHRSWGGPVALYGFQPPAIPEAQAGLDREVMIVVMLESPEAIENVDAIAATPGIDALLIGTSDLTSEMGIPGQIGHERVQAAYRAMIEACARHGRFPGMGGVYDDQWAAHYLKAGVRLALGGSDHQFLLQAASARSAELRAMG